MTDRVRAWNEKMILLRYECIVIADHYIWRRNDCSLFLIVSKSIKATPYHYRVL
jgi:hypothetical protein